MPEPREPPVSREQAERFATSTLGQTEGEERMARTIVALYDRCEELQSELRKWEEREAAVCPEDVGFEEYIATLERQVQAGNRV